MEISSHSQPQIAYIAMNGIEIRAYLELVKELIEDSALSETIRQYLSMYLQSLDNLSKSCFIGAHTEAYVSISQEAYISILGSKLVRPYCLPG
jgi:hypothetical protein